MRRSAKLKAVKPRVLILLGPPGAGKGSQAALIKNKIGLPHIATGNLLREQIILGAPLGLQAKRFMDAGNFPPEELVINMLLERIAQPDCSEGFILDGFPRTLHQAEVLSNHLSDKANIAAVSLELADSDIIARIVGRLVCKGCQTPYHLTLAPPAKSGTCDQCQEPLIQRDDDSESIAKRRVEVYHEQTAPLIEYYHSRGLLHPIQASQPKDAVLAQILELLTVTA
jgi:adenylate kinase